VTIQGFGNVGSFTAKFLNDLKIRVVGVSDVSGFVYDRDGLNIPQLMKDMEGKEKLADLSEIKNGSYSYDISDKDRIFEVGADVFIPAAMTGVINDRTAPKILDQGIKVIVEAANIPTTPSADQYLIKKGLLVIPDFLANSGGVIGSFVEYQGRTEKEAFDLISYKIAKNVKQSLADSFLEADSDSTKNLEVNVRKVATESSKQKLYRAMLLRKGAINVAREAYARK
jgi:glutamate dehydrogenase (NAD(P)+)